MIQKLKNKHQNVYKLSKTKSSHFDRTRGDKNQIFRTIVDPEVGRMQMILRNDYYKREMAEVFRDDRPGGPESTPPGWNRVTDMSQLDFPKLSVEDIATLMKRK